MRYLKGSLLVMMAVLILTAACAKKAEEPMPEPEPAVTEVTEVPETMVASAELMGQEGSEVHGDVTFTQTGDEVTVDVAVEGVSPGTHGFHVHEVGDCSAPDFTSAGGHFNPDGVEHACPPAESRHSGDLGNIEAGEDGMGHLSLTVPASLLSVAEGDHSVVGRGVILHADADDCESQPTGAAGARLACGVVALENGDMVEHMEGEMDDDMDHGEGEMEGESEGQH